MLERVVDEQVLFVSVRLDVLARSQHYRHLFVRGMTGMLKQRGQLDQ